MNSDTKMSDRMITGRLIYIDLRKGKSLSTI